MEPEGTGAAVKPARSMRARTIRAAIISIAILAVAAAAAATAARYLLDETRLKSELSAKLGRKIECAKIEPGLFSVAVTDLVVGDTAGFDANPLLEAKELRFGYSFLPLLFGRLSISEASISGARIGIEYDAKKNSNVADLVAPSEQKGLIEIETLKLDDVAIGVVSPQGKVALEHVSGRLSNLRGAPYLFDLAGSFLDRPVTARGSYRPGSGPLEVALTADKLPLSGLPIPSGILDAAGMTADLDLTLALANDTAHVQGTADLAGLGKLDGNVAIGLKEPMTAKGLLALTTDAVGLRRVVALRKPLQDLQAAGGIRASVALDGPVGAMPNHAQGEFLDFSVKPEGFRSRLEHLRGNFSATPSLVTLRGVTLGAEGQRLSVDGTIALPKKNLDLIVKGDPVDLGVLTGLLDPPILPNGASLSGRGAVDLKLVGASPDIAASGSVRLDGASMTTREPHAELKDIRGAITLSPSKISFPSLDAHFGSSALHASGDYDPKKKTVDATLHAPDVALEDLRALGATTLDVKGKASFDGKVGGSLDQPRVSGDISSPSLALFGVAVRDLAANLNYDESKISVKSFAVKLLGGLVTGTASAGLSDKDLPFDAVITAEGLGLPETARTLAGVGNIVGGLLAGHLTLHGVGASEQTYSGEGEISVKDAGFGSVAALSQLAPFLGISPDAIRNFSGGSARFKIDNGAVELRNALKLENRDIAIFADGRIGLRGSLGLSCRAELPAGGTLAQIGGHPLAQIMGIKTSGDRTVVPFKLGGTLSAPAFALDLKPEEAIANMIDNKLGVPGAASDTGASLTPREELMRAILNRAKPANETESPAETPATSPENEAIGVLDRLLHRK